MEYKIMDILKLEVAPALGCTEPTAVALAAAAAASLLQEHTIDKIELSVDSNIYKNGMAVAIPRAKGACGIDMAAALGMYGGDPLKGLEVLSTITEDHLKTAKEFVHKGKVSINVLKDKKQIFINIKLTAGSHFAECVITDLHDHIVSLSKNNQPVSDHPLISVKGKDKKQHHKLEAWLKERTLDELISMPDQLDQEGIDFIRQGVETNIKLADHGLTHGSGLGVGSTLQRLVREGLLKKDMIIAARILTSAASDARMSGVNLPAMSSAGSGNHGLTAILPIWAVKDFIVCDDESRVYRAIALSHIITVYIKAHTGRLTAICGCSIAAGAGATAGTTYLMGGNSHHIAGAIKNVIGDLAGVICDGAKAGCALKLATAAGNAVQSALFALHGLDIKGTDGIVAITPEDTMRNVGQLSTQGMIEADHTILDIMIRKQFADI